MEEIASRQQLRLAFLRWAMVTVPLILLLGFASARIFPSGSQNPWFAALEKPAGMPSEALFPWIWAALYVLIGLAFALVLHARGARLRGVAIAAFLVQLALNLAWSPLFFGAHAVFVSEVVIVLLFVTALATTILFGRIRAVAAWLMVPYLAWIVAAAVLTVQIARLNPNAETLVPSSGTAQMTL